MKKVVNRPVRDLPLSEDTELLEKARTMNVLNVPGGNGNGRHHNGGTGVASLSEAIAHFQLDAPTCPNCGHVAVRNGACYKCLNCGESLGCS